MVNEFMIHYKGQLKRIIWLSEKKKKKNHNPDNVQSKHKFK